MPDDAATRIRSACDPRRTREGDAMSLTAGRRQFLVDALPVGGFLNTLLRRSDRVRIGCLAQIVDVIAPLVTNERGVLR
jgi:alpha-L-arabinofuranosidase